MEIVDTARPPDVRSSQILDDGAYMWRNGVSFHSPADLLGVMSQ
jgi:hypothetical protein